MSDEEVREAVDELRAIKKHSYADLIERLAAERDDAWRICATWRERAHVAEAKETPAAEEADEKFIELLNAKGISMEE